MLVLGFLLLLLAKGCYYRYMNNTRRNIGFGLIILILVLGFGLGYMDRSGGLDPAVREDLVEAYLRDNIGNLSPEGPVLGGTFYVTDVDLTGENQGVVSYEDGHIALAAVFEYEISGGEVEIASFELLPNRQ